MKASKLIKILKLTGNIYVAGAPYYIYEKYRKVMYMYSEKTLIVKNLEFFGVLSMFPPDLTKSENWITYETCVDLYLGLESNNVPYLEVTCYKGSSLDGTRTDKKFKLQVLLNASQIKIFSEDIIYALRREADRAYEIHLESQREIFINNFIGEVMRICE